MIKAAPLRGTASGAPRAGLGLGEARPARPRRPSRQAARDLTGSSRLGCRVRSRLPRRTIVPVASATSRARFARRCAIGVPPTLDLTAARKGSAPMRKPAESRDGVERRYLGAKADTAGH